MAGAGTVQTPLRRPQKERGQAHPPLVLVVSLPAL